MLAADIPPVGLNIAQQAMSPEVLRAFMEQNAHDPDIEYQAHNMWGVGRLLVYMLIGIHPFGAHGLPHDLPAPGDKEAERIHFAKHHATWVQSPYRPSSSPPPKNPDIHKLMYLHRSAHLGLQ